MILVAFPTQFEAEDFIKLLTNSSEQKIEEIACTTGKIGEIDVRVAIVGMGGVIPPRRIETLLKQDQYSMVLLAGFAGALVREIKSGHILIAGNHTSTDTLNYIKIISGFDIASLYTAKEVVATSADKLRLGEETACQFVDMEAEHVAPVVRGTGIELMVVRVISDTADQDLPADLLASGYDYVTAKETPVKMALKLIFNPGKIKQLREFIKPLPAARKKLADFLITLIPELP